VWADQVRAIQISIQEEGLNPAGYRYMDKTPLFVAVFQNDPHAYVVAENQKENKKANPRDRY
jgi:hypothetical protein